MTYLLNEQIKVRCTPDYTPQDYTWQQRVYVVSTIANRWRVDIEWWQVRVWREYFKLATTCGVLAVVYRDLVGGEWYIQRIYD